MAPLNKSLFDPENDLALRAPMGRSVGDGTKDYTVEIRPLLYRMYIACHILRLGTEARFSALIYLHRYVAASSTTRDNSNNNGDYHQSRKSDTACSSNNMEWVAAASLFLACKAEEQPRRLRDVINLIHMLLSSDDDRHPNGTGATTRTIELRQRPPNLNEAYWDAKQKIVETEQQVLRWLAFDVSVSHPHRLVSLLLQEYKTIPVAAREALLRVAFRRLNDALFHGPALKHPVLELACAAIELSARETHQDEIIQQLTQCYASYNLTMDTVALAKRDLEEASHLLGVVDHDK